MKLSFWGGPAVTLQWEHPGRMRVGSIASIHKNRRHCDFEAQGCCFHPDTLAQPHRSCTDDTR